MLLQVVLGVVVIFVMITLMSVGVLFGRKPIKGSCGGIGNALNQDDYECEFCGGDPTMCDTLTENEKNMKDSGGLGYDVSGEGTKRH